MFFKLGEDFSSNSRKMVNNTASEKTDDLVQQIRRFVAHQSGIPTDKIGAESTLVEDLGIDAADGVDLMLAFSKAFAVDISSMNLGLYFGDEGLSLLPWRRWRRAAPITVADLVVAARLKRWPVTTQTIQAMQRTAPRSDV